jgi:hypothetical protein
LHFALRKQGAKYKLNLFFVSKNDLDQSWRMRIHTRVAMRSPLVRVSLARRRISGSARPTHGATAGGA